MAILVIPNIQMRFACYFDRLHDFSVAIPSCHKGFNANTFFPLTVRTWNSLSYSLMRDLNCYKSGVSRHVTCILDVQYSLFLK